VADQELALGVLEDIEGVVDGMKCHLNVPAAGGSGSRVALLFARSREKMERFKQRVPIACASPRVRVPFYRNRSKQWHRASPVDVPQRAQVTARSLWAPLPACVRAIPRPHGTPLVSLKKRVSPAHVSGLNSLRGEGLATALAINRQANSQLRSRADVTSLRTSMSRVCYSMSLERDLLYRPCNQ